LAREITLIATATALPELLTRPEVARALRVSPVTVDRLLSRRELASLTVTDRRLVRRADLEEYIARRLAASQG
jgi:excisionase family DNA binding protein